MSEKPSSDMENLATTLSNRGDVVLAIVFGSVANGRARVDSDVDVAIQLDQPLDVDHKMSLIEDIARVTGRPVDLIDLHGVGEPLLGEILRHGKRIIGSDHDFAELALRHVYAVEDFVPYLERLYRERNDAWIR